MKSKETHFLANLLYKNAFKWNSAGTYELK